MTVIPMICHLKERIEGGKNISLDRAFKEYACLPM